LQIRLFHWASTSRDQPGVGRPPCAF
jgi:hypothetical protein